MVTLVGEEQEKRLDSFLCGQPYQAKKRIGAPAPQAVTNRFGRLIAAIAEWHHEPCGMMAGSTPLSH